MPVRIAVVDKDLCQPRKCSQECIRFCPIVRSGKRAIYMDEQLGHPVITDLCTACGICVRKCPFEAITIVNLPSELGEDCVHQYGPSGFKLFRLPMPKPGRVLGIIGQNAMGKTTIAKILSGELKPNLCTNTQSSVDDIIRFFRGTELQPYLNKLYRSEIRVVHKPQYIELIPMYVKGTVKDVLMKVGSEEEVMRIAGKLNLMHLLNRDVSKLSGGELQRLAIAAALLRGADTYIFDEPTTHLDIVERMRVAEAIRDTAGGNKYVIVIDHDLAVLDYLADQVVILYGKPGAYGIVSHMRGAREGINEYLSGYLASENMLIRREPIKFRVKPAPRPIQRERILLEWTDLVKRLGDFKLEVRAGVIHRGEVIGVLGPNGIGKTTFARLLVNEVEPDSGVVIPHGEARISYKPQYVRDLAIKYGDKTVREYLAMTAGNDFNTRIIWPDLANGLSLIPLMDRELSGLSGGELQRVVVAGSLLKDVEVYLLDEPMAYLDIEQRVRVASVIRRIIEERDVIALVIEHDITMIDYLSTSVMVFLGEPGKHGIAESPTDLRAGMNEFLKNQDVTFRREPQVGRPRINKRGSYLDRLQRSIGEYYYYMSTEETEETETKRD
ncbi:ribosome biogenesis/translation initiation ATPase RLI [Vulcanisaeta souniana]|uniref:Ribosome biogenesis/translation initiation ATPase RLI n=1 Tax=Vulcanisaeta souniana JCM 11219 TaxID=1293586 RepID=A0A830DZB5_9CREN|nr:ribosome biogenesis/translation initiation ATPase RLI [Vulcanisaeta souniana]BDR92164.1 ribosome biogenesis/translation initiation ATPase RLI [Vulcanisaeta souniana JCM 11219]GGI67465.1 ribosome biogenesis/translation initiation ATPase RLI [Vulcanisaeta souniana JCM 11219]